jgi:hypothetical protein
MTSPYFICFFSGKDFSGSLFLWLASRSGRQGASNENGHQKIILV